MPSSGIESSGLNLWLRERRFRKRMLAANAEVGAFVLSYPKSGRTWHRILLGYYLTRILDRDPRDAMKLEMLCAAAGIPRIEYTHNGAAISAKLPPTSDVMASPIEWQGKKVLLLVREPRDVLVSAYFHCRYRHNFYDGTLPDFIRHPYVGIEKILSALNRWHGNRNLASSFEVILYEDMRRDPKEALRRTIRFAGLPEPVPALIDETVEFASLENLQRLEQTNFFGMAAMQNESGDERGRKVRSGKVGGFREHLSGDDLKFIEEAEKRAGNPFRNPAHAA